MIIIKKICCIFISGFLIFISFSVITEAQDGSVTQSSCSNSWMSQQTITGNWGGLRDDLEDQGITISSNFTTDIGGNPTGGLKRRTTYAGFYDLGIALDFEKIASLKGVALTVSNSWASGKNLSDAIGNFYGVQEIFAPGDYYLSQIDLSISMLDDTVILEGGRLFAGDVFATSSLWQYYVNGGINSNLGAMGSNIFFPSFQIASWATRITYQPDDKWHFVAGLYNADPKVEKINNHGADFSFDTDDGYLAITQLTYKHHQSREDEGMPGSACFGGYYESSKFQDLSDATKMIRGNYGLYMIFDQMVYKGDWPEFTGPSHLRSEAKDSERIKHPYHPQTAIALDRPKGITVWGGAYLAPEENTNPQIFQLASGLVSQGLFPFRERDVTAFCVIIGKFSDKLQGQDVETVIELDHRFQINSWCYVTPDIQYVFRPNGQNDIKNSLVLGLEISLNF